MRTKSFNTYSFFLAGCLIAAVFCRCTKLVEVDGPVTSTSGQDIYTTDATAASVLTGIYTKMSQSSLSSGGTSLNQLSLFAGLSADELKIFSGVANPYLSFYTNALNNTTTTNFWNTSYPVIFIANSAIEGITAATTLTPSVKQQLLGEAKFIRAFNYFYLAGLYGDVPLATTKNYQVNTLLPRSPQEDVYKQVITDLKDAQALLSATYYKADILTSTTDRVRPTSWAATALLARAYLYTGNWAGAEAQASTLINNSSTFSLSTLANAFIKSASGNNEAIWQLQPVNTGWNTEDARIFLLPSSGPTTTTYPVYLTTNLLSSFENGDGRKTAWTSSVTVNNITYSYPTKYKSATQNNPVTEHEIVLRLAEQFLIRAEARAQQGNLTGTNSALSDLNAIRTRAGLTGYSGATDKASMLSAILHERQVELFTEWGHRWFDLKRTGNVDAVMTVVTPQKGGTWKSSWQWYPIALTELQANPNLVQNTDY